MRLTNQKGSLIVMTLLLIVVLITLGSAFVIISVNEGRVAQRQRRTVLAFNNAEAGIQRALYNLREDFVSDLTTPSWSDGNINGAPEDMDGYDIGPNTVDFYSMPYSNTAMNGGSYSVQLKNVGTQGIWIKSTGTVGDTNQTILVYAKINRVSPWDNAIFAGTGSNPGTGSTVINGNVNIAGSVHILGTGLTASDYAVELGGTAELIGNNYATMDATLKRRIPALPTTIVGGETVETLNAELRIKHGKVGLDGSSSVGNANQAGNTYKETVDKVYVTDGWGGNAGTGNVHSDNGWSNSYDMGDSISFPSLAEPYGGYATYQQYLRDHALVISDATNLAKLANITSSSNFTLTDAGGKGSISMNGSGQMTISGIVYVDGGTLGFGGASTITYSGKGSILVTGNVSVNTNLVTAAVPVGGERNFPIKPSTGQENVIGIMTPSNISLGTSSQLDIMGLFYSQGTTTINKQTDLIGTIVTNYFDLTGQVPNIFQVPETSNYLPPGMIGTTSGWSMSIVSWQRL